MEQAVISFILGLADKYPLAVTIFMVIGVLRAVFKPAMAFFRTIVSATPSKKDDEVLNKVEASKAYLKFAWFIDYISSIKLPGYDIKKP